MLAVHACPLRGRLTGVTAWTMTRVFTGQGRAYNQFLIGLAILALTVFGSAVGSDVSSTGGRASSFGWKRRWPRATNAQRTPIFRAWSAPASANWIGSWMH